MADTLITAVAATRRRCDAVRRLAEAGWELQRSLSVVKLVASVKGQPAALLEEVQGGGLDGVTVTLRGTFDDASLTVIVDPDGEMRVQNPQPPIDAARYFGYSMVDTVRDAFEGATTAALSLPGEWTLTAGLNLSCELARVCPDFEWLVCADVNEIEALIRSVLPWKTGPLLDKDKAIIFVVEDLDPDSRLAAGNCAVLPLVDEAVIASTNLGLGAAGNWPELPTILAHAARPEALAPTLVEGNFLTTVAELLWQLCATISWLALASSIEMAGNALAVEIFGLQRVTHTVSSNGISINVDGARRAYDMYRWASGRDSTDQRLAVQQVASLYRDFPPWNSSADVFDAALSVFSTLRRDAVAEVLAARRNARSLAIDVAQRATDAAAAAARATVERCVATFLAISGVIVARTTNALTEHQAHDLRLLLAILLIGLVPWNAFVEGPPLTAPLRNLEADLPQVADLLTDAERRKIMKLAAVTSARHRTVIVRMVVPVVYGTAAVAAWLVR